MNTKTTLHNAVNTQVNSTWNEPKKHFHEAINSNWYKTISQIISSILNSTFEFYKQINIHPVCLPITCGSVSSPIGLGSDSVPVNIKLFNEDVYLADSMQFHLEYQLRQGFDGVFYVMPSFRGEEPDARHLNQFFHSEAEIKGDLNSVMKLVENYIKKIVRDLCENNAKEIYSITNDLTHLEGVIDQNYSIPRITFKNAFELLNGDGKYFNKHNNDALSINNLGEHELIKYFDGPVWLTHLPTNTVPFYQAWDNSNNDYSLTADLLMGIGETVGCGQRHMTYHELEKSLDQHHVNKAEYEWYLQLKKNYPIKTSGFGLGLERFILWILKHNDIRDISLLNRLKGIRTYV